MGLSSVSLRVGWVPACAGMTSREFSAAGHPHRDLVIDLRLTEPGET
jgi:hypothetical protein